MTHKESRILNRAFLRDDAKGLKMRRPRRALPRTNILVVSLGKGIESFIQRLMPAVGVMPYWSAYYQS